MAKKIDPDVEARLFRNVFVCRHCKAKIRALPSQIAEGRVKCRRCGRRDAWRPKRSIRILTATK
ncbi:MAG: hypothetical protein QXQ14_03310 [Candidatus Aenigmatarchaeota archaeon]